MLPENGMVKDGHTLFQQLLLPLAHLIGMQLILCSLKAGRLQDNAGWKDAQERPRPARSARAANKAQALGQPQNG
jgi:hypothetical protein